MVCFSRETQNSFKWQVPVFEREVSQLRRFNYLMLLSSKSEIRLHFFVDVQIAQVAWPI